MVQHEMNSSSICTEVIGCLKGIIKKMQEYWGSVFRKEKMLQIIDHHKYDLNNDIAYR